MATPPRVIDWDEAMEQCGDDEEFLRELLADLRGETDAQVAKIEETIRVRTYSYIQISVTNKFTLCVAICVRHNRAQPNHRFTASCGHLMSSKEQPPI